ncbi:hypothetical protein FCU45_09980 [Sulfurimonas crateris]|uniref:DUF1104 domain-containing protein n=1 Tax=Sulfurimonas crateris TaxID=2574727 RepID=A0A4U2Z5K0_9BACT|nr:hypothetical protein [Sulfurimonas crateris]TKI68730.1 hypothetical protein FCU45_09980 [Sulfurimonas crateris]
MKKQMLSAALLLSLTITSLLAEVDVDSQIEALKSATPQDRVRLMNEFKTTLSTLSQEERAEAIEQFRSSMEVENKQIQARERARERVRLNQMDETMQGQENQRMNQNQVGSQFLQQNPSITPDALTTPNRFMKK